MAEDFNKRTPPPTGRIILYCIASVVVLLALGYISQYFS